MKKEKNYMGFHIPKVWQILKRFAGAFHWAQTSYFWSVRTCCNMYGYLVTTHLVLPSTLRTQNHKVSQLLIWIPEHFLVWRLDEGSVLKEKNSHGIWTISRKNHLQVCEPKFKTYIVLMTKFDAFQYLINMIASSINWQSLGMIFQFL